MSWPYMNNALPLLTATQGYPTNFRKEKLSMPVPDDEYVLFASSSVASSPKLTESAGCRHSGVLTRHDSGQHMVSEKHAVLSTVPCEEEPGLMQLQRELRELGLKK